MRHREKILPISWDGWDEGGDYGDIQFYNVIFLDDWGPFKKNQKFNDLYISYCNGKMIAHKGNKETEVKFTLIPCD